MKDGAQIPSIHIKRQVQWPALVILEAGKLRQEDPKFDFSETQKKEKTSTFCFEYIHKDSPLFYGEYFLNSYIEGPEMVGEMVGVAQQMEHGQFTQHYVSQPFRVHFIQESLRH